MVYAEERVNANANDGSGNGNADTVRKMRGLRFSEMDDDQGMYASALAAEAALRDD